MSVSSVSDSSSSITQQLLEQMRSSSSSEDTDSFANSIISSLDTDEDSLLTLEESGMSDKMFSDIDADGDGTLSAEELSAVMQEKMEQMRSMMGALSMLMSSDEEEEDASSVIDEFIASINGSFSSSTGESESSKSAEGTAAAGETESEEEYDEFDLNEDGEVSMQELLIAYQSGVSSLGDIFGSSDSDELGGGASSIAQRLAQAAYSIQS